MSDDDRQEAFEQLSNRLGDMRAFLDAAQDGQDVYDDEWNEELGDLGNYGLEWAKAITDHRAETVTYVHVLSTGGPHEEFQVTFDPSKGKVEDVMFVSLPWFGREEIHLSRDGYPTAWDFYETFYGDLVEMAWHEEQRDANG